MKRLAAHDARRVVALALALAAGCASENRDVSDWERQNAPRLQQLSEPADYPAYPKSASLLPFEAPGAAGFRFFVDGATLEPGKDGVVRYVLVARSPDGAQNVSYEGLRCATGEQRVYAIGHDGGWSPAHGEWRRVSQPRHVTLYREYFCPQSEPIRSADEGRLALEQGGHPFYKGFGSNLGKGR